MRYRTGMQTLGTGEMSRASGLSLKALRLYAASGLLVPAEVDARTGYRRYGEAELARARSIQALRRVGLPLRRVRELIDAPPERLRAELAVWWSAERSAFARRSQVVDVVTEVSVQPELHGSAASSALDARVRVVHRAAQKTASITRVVEQSELVPTTIADVIALRHHLARPDAGPLAAHQLIFHEPVGMALPGRIETAVPYAGSCDPAGEIVLRAVPAGAFVAIDVTAEELVYPALLRFYDVIARAAERHGGALGAPRELYEQPWSTAPGDVVATIATPIAVVSGAALDSAPGADRRLES
ncbi:MerR family transcriptional regulator [Agromyces italicus]|uniref:MerR family transcriptional regulator n=1 Tax=Agromyces italicus TaxID=279572 RepID=UPI0004260035|nr:MerR family transcriptional regulator [Agromyces italicus]